MISLTSHFRQKHEVWLHFFDENAQYDPKTHSYEDNAEFHSGNNDQLCYMLSAKTVSDQKFWISVQILQKCWL